jgi:hypothetical protein
MEMVRIYDVESRSVYEIPAAELAPGMVAANVEGIEETVWIDRDQLQKSEPQHGPFSEEVRDYIRQIKAYIDEVYCLSLEEWEDGFRRDRDPGQEIGIWLHVGRTFHGLMHDGSFLPDQKEDVFRILSGCLVAPRERVLDAVERGALSKHDAERIVDAFYEEGDQGAVS